MNPLVQKILAAHGGLERWERHSQLSAQLQQGGALWAMKGHAGVLDSARVTVGLREQWATHAPFGAVAHHSRFTPRRVALLAADGSELQALERPRDSFAGHTLQTPWTPLQLAYFAGCAMWTYLNLPFLLTRPDVACEELSPWQEGDEVWRRLRVVFPAAIATHSTVQTLYVDEAGLLRRHDYDVEIAGSTPGAHLIDGYVEVQGLRFPTRRRIYPRTPDGQPMAEPLVVSIDLSDFELT